MTLLYLDPIFTRHLTGKHPENPRRIEAIDAEFNRRGLIDKCIRPNWQPATYVQQHAVHTADYIGQLQEIASSGGGQVEQDTFLSPQSWHVTQSAAGAACDAVQRIVNREDSSAFCVIRPPGHHALRSTAMGFCLLNNVAIAARFATEMLKLNRVLIIDWDVHHGNGTQAIFYNDPRVAFYSIHRWPFYPGTGDSDETGTGAALGTTKNDPVQYGTSRTSFINTFRDNVTDFADRIKPELILLSAGFDAHRLDPVGSLGLETEDFIQLTDVVKQVASVHCQNRIVSLLEGGYHPGALAQSAAVHLEALLNN